MPPKTKKKSTTPRRRQTRPPTNPMSTAVSVAANANAAAVATLAEAPAAVTKPSEFYVPEEPPSPTAEAPPPRPMSHADILLTPLHASAATTAPGVVDESRRRAGEMEPFGSNPAAMAEYAKHHDFETEDPAEVPAAEEQFAAEPIRQMTWEDSVGPAVAMSETEARLHFDFNFTD